VLGFLAAARRTRGRWQPLFDDVTVPQLVLLDAVEACGEDGVAAVAAYAGLTQPTITRGTAALERDGLLRRVPAERDARRRALSLTPEGCRLLAEKRALVAGHLAGAWDRLDETARSLVVPLLRHLADLVESLV
jgi:DNA-binding MarR family transcriptional regulator